MVRLKQLQQNKKKKMALQCQLVCSVATKSSVVRLCPSLSLSLSIRSEKGSSEASEKTGVGFGSSSSSSTSTSTSSNSKKKQQKKGRRERASIIRRTPLEKPPFASEEEKGIAKEQGKNESAFLLAWLGFGAIILVEGITLAASGLLPEEWDKLFVKYLYPSFTPTVFLFVAGAVAYGVYKYLQNEKITEQK